LTLASICPFENPRRVYCAGPLFNEAERQEMLRLAAVLAAAGFEPFVPHADGMEFAQVRPYLVAQGYPPDEVGQLLHEAVFALDVYQVAVGCGSLVFNMNGRVPDEGGVAELTLAWTLGKPVVLYKEDARSAIAARDNPLVVGQTGFTTLVDLEQVPTALAQKILEEAPAPGHRVPLAPRLAAAVEAGGRLWRRLEALGPARPNEAVARIVRELFAGNRHAALLPTR
jgi:nucleoside 2-deoxyribosyltransferase